MWCFARHTNRQGVVLLCRTASHPSCNCPRGRFYTQVQFVLVHHVSSLLMRRAVATTSTSLTACGQIRVLLISRIRWDGSSVQQEGPHRTLIAALAAVARAYASSPPRAGHEGRPPEKQPQNIRRARTPNNCSIAPLRSSFVIGLGTPHNKWFRGGLTASDRRGEMHGPASAGKSTI